LISNSFYYILELGMCLQKCARIFLICTTTLAVLLGCGALDAILPSTGTYKINAMVNDTPLDDFSVVTLKDKVLPFFEDPVSDDPDITELVVFLKDSRGQVVGYKVTYSLIGKENKEDGKELQPGQDSKTENKDENKTDDAVTTKEDTSAEKKKDETVTGTGANTTANTDKKETTTAGTNTNAAANTTTGTDKKETTTTAGAADNNTTADADKKETAATAGAADNNTTADADKTNKDKNETAAVNTAPWEAYEHTKNGNEINFPVKSLDKKLPFLPIPANLPIGKYTLVFQVKGKNSILYKFEKPLFYMADAEFSFEGIQVHLPGIADSLQFIQNKNVVLLAINLDFDSRLEPYVVWYNGKKIIDEGRYSDGAGTLFWKAPEQNGFVSIRAEVFPSWDKSGLTGYQKGISLLVSSKEVDMHLLSKDTANLVQWYVFEDDLKESLTKDNDSGELAIEPAGKNKLNWMPSNGTYGLAAGTDNAFKLPAVPLTNSENKSENWQIVSRFKPLGEGEIYSVQFGSADTTASLSVKKPNLVLSLVSASKVYSESLKLPDEDDSFIAVSVKFIIHNGIISAKLAFVRPNEDFNNQKEPVINPISAAAEIDKDFKVILGHQQKKPADNAQTEEGKDISAEPSVSGQPFTALWDELAILRLPEVKIITIKKDTKDTKEAHAAETVAVEIDTPEAPAAGIPDDESTLPE